MIDLRDTGAGEPVTEADLNDTIADLLERSGSHPAYVHAVRTCGYMVTETNEAMWDVEDVEQWDDAIDEWFALNPDGLPLD